LICQPHTKYEQVCAIQHVFDYQGAAETTAAIRVLVRRILRKYGYPPDKQEKATQTVLEQAKLLCGDWAEQI
jgi:hypothetical protein